MQSLNNGPYQVSRNSTHEGSNLFRRDLLTILYIYTLHKNSSAGDGEQNRLGPPESPLIMEPGLILVFLILKALVFLLLRVLVFLPLRVPLYMPKWHYGTADING